MAGFARFATPSSMSADLTSVPAPIGGLNAIDSLAAMPATDAIVMTNVVPQPYGAMVRKGYIQHATGLPGPVPSLAELASRDGSVKAYAWSDTGMYDITAIGAVGAPIVTALASPWWQWTNMGNSAGTHLVAFNGFDNGIWIHNNGASITRLTLGDGIVTGTWNGVDPANLIQCTVHQHRLWAVEEDTTVGWYLPPDQIFGVASPFDFGPLFKMGGYLAVLATWTIDAGDGSDDKLVAISSNGEAVVYSGLNPSSSTTWSLVGVYFVGSPVRGRRFYTNVAGDLFLVTLTGVVSMATLVTSTQVNVSSNNTYSKKIQFLLSDMTGTLGDLDGWQIFMFPSINLLFINVPSVFFGGSGQVVANQINSAWCLFTGMDALVWARVDGQPYFGAPDGVVYRAWFGDTDKVLIDLTGGTNIQSRVQTAYSYFGKTALQKQIGMYRPNLSVVRPVSLSSQWLYDFKQVGDTFPSGAPPTPSGSALWGIAIWGTDLWSGGIKTQRDWYQATGLGVAASLDIRFSTDCETIWISTDLSLKSGMIL
jgi:hypothetical protein